MIDTSLPSDYARARERRRRSGRWVGVVLVVGFGVSTGMKSGRVGVIVLTALVAALILVLLAARLRIVWSMRGTEPHLSAQLPAAVARRAGQQIKATLKDTTEFLGRVNLSRSQIIWTPSKASGNRSGASLIAWPTQGISDLRVVRIRNPIIPMSLLYFRDPQGAEVHLWVRRPAQYVTRVLSSIGCS